jgi:hypothetical protein
MTAAFKTGIEKINTFMENSKWVLAIVAALWAGYEYYHNDYVRKVDRTQAYISKHVEITHVKTAVDDFWEHNKDKVTFEWDPDRKTEGRFKDATYARVGELIATNDDLRKNVHHLSHFYHNVAVCLNDRLCDLATTCDAFFGDVQNYRNIHVTYLEQFASNWQIDKHTQMERLVQTCNLFQATRK